MVEVGLFPLLGGLRISVEIGAGFLLQQNARLAPF